MGIVKNNLDSIRAKLIKMISRSVDLMGKTIKLTNYSVGLNPSLKTYWISKEPYVMCDEATRLVEEVDTDTLVEIADEIVEKYMFPDESR